MKFNLMILADSSGIMEIFKKIIPVLIGFMGFALPIALSFGEAFKNIIKPLAYLMPSNSLVLYILAFILIITVGSYLNYKYPYRKKPKEFEI